jgi:hypothetical protein
VSRSGLTTTTDDTRRKDPTRARDRAYARGQALARLAARHSDEFEALYAEERQHLGLLPVDRGTRDFVDAQLLCLVRGDPSPGLEAAARATGLSTEGARQGLMRLVAAGNLRIVPTAPTGRSGRKRTTFEVATAK